MVIDQFSIKYLVKEITLSSHFNRIKFSDFILLWLSLTFEISLLDFWRRIGPNLRKKLVDKVLNWDTTLSKTKYENQ